MKVYIITREPFPNGMAATNRIKCYAKALIQEGVQCKVLIFIRTENKGTIIKNIEGKGVFEGIPFQYIGGTPIRKSNVFIRKMDDYLDRLRLAIYLKRNLREGDIVLCYCGVFVFFINWLIGIIHSKKAKFIKDVCELPYGTSKENKSNIRKRNIMLRKQFPKCNGFISISDALKDLVDKYKSPSAKNIKIPIMVDFEKYSLEDRSNQAAIPYIFHSGTLYEQKDGILGMIEAFGKVCQMYDKPLNFISTGFINKSPHAKDIRGLIHRYKLADKIYFTGYLSVDELQEYLSKASLVIINKYDTQQNKYCFSTKLAEYLAAEKTIILTNVGEAMCWLRDQESAYIVEPKNLGQLSNKIIYALENKEKSKLIAQRGKQVCMNYFDYKQYGRKLINFFIDC